LSGCGEISQLSTDLFWSHLLGQLLCPLLAHRLQYFLLPFLKSGFPIFPAYYCAQILRGEPRIIECRAHALKNCAIVVTGNRHIGNIGPVTAKLAEYLQGGIAICGQVIRLLDSLSLSLLHLLQIRVLRQHVIRDRLPFAQRFSNHVPVLYGRIDPLHKALNLIWRQLDLSRYGAFQLRLGIVIHAVQQAFNGTNAGCRLTP
jgi:hypothetical protein